MAALMYNVSRGFVIFAEHSLLFRGHNQILVNSRRYVRALRRRPVAVLYPNGERETFIKSKETADKMNQKMSKLKGKNLSDSDNKYRKERVSERAGNKKWSGHHVSECAEESPHIMDRLGGLRYEKAPAGDNRLA